MLRWDLESNTEIRLQNGYRIPLTILETVLSIANYITITAFGLKISFGFRVNLGLVFQFPTSKIPGQR